MFLIGEVNKGIVKDAKWLVEVMSVFSRDDAKRKSGTDLLGDLSRSREKLV